MTKSFKCLLIAVLSVFILSSVCSIEGNAMTHILVSRVNNISSNSIVSYFAEGQPADGTYGTTKGKTIRQSWVRLTEGSYDKVAYSATGCYRVVKYNQLSVSLRKSNNWLYNCYLRYGWFYY